MLVLNSHSHCSITRFLPPENSQSEGKLLTTSVLTVESLQPGDEGVLQCTMVLGEKTVRSKVCQLVMIGIVQPPVDTVVLIGASARLYCIATGVCGSIFGRLFYLLLPGSWVSWFSEFQTRHLSPCPYIILSKLLSFPTTAQYCWCFNWHHHVQVLRNPALSGWRTEKSLLAGKIS